jgi:predicted PurR-regulated permease PerM
MLGFDRDVARAAWTVLCLALLLYGVYIIRQTLFILVLAIFLAYAVHPLIALAERDRPRRLPRSVIIGVVFALVITVVSVSIVMLGSQVGEQAARLGEQIPALKDNADLLNRIPLPHWLEVYRPRLNQWLRDQLSSGAAQAFPFVREVGTRALHVAGNAIFVVLIPILSFMLIKDAATLRATFLGWIEDPSARRTWQTMLDDTNLLLGRYIRALLLLSIATLIAYSLAFELMGVPYALLLAAIAAVLEFVPLIGPLLALGIALTVAAVSGYDNLLWILLFVAAYRVFQDYVLSPFLMSEGVNIHPLLVILGILAGEQIAGMAGMFLAVPVLAIARIVLRACRPGASTTVNRDL